MGTIMDNRDKLNKFTSGQVAQLVEKATLFAGHMALRLVHDHLLRLDLAHYDKVIRKSVSVIISKVKDVKSVSVCLFFFSDFSIKCHQSVCWLNCVVFIQSVFVV